MSTTEEQASASAGPVNPFGAVTVTASAGAAALAVIQREVAEVQAAMVIAQRFPRDERAAMDRILTACTRPTLAEAAVYEYPRGREVVTGPSIRLAEELARGWGNIVCGVTELSRANGVSECLAYAWDLQTNFRDEKRFQVRHWRDTKKGGYALTDERDIYETIANQGARRKRACVLAVIPGDVVEAAVNQCITTVKSAVEVTPESLAKLLEGFAQYGVTREHIEKRMQRRLEAMTPAGLMQFRRIYVSLRDGLGAAADWFDMGAPPAAAEDQPQPGAGVEGVKARLKGVKQKPPEEPLPIADERAVPPA